MPPGRSSASVPCSPVKYDGHACIVNGKLIALLPRRFRSLRGWHDRTGETNQEALKLFTANAAWTDFDQTERGSLEVGKVADMAILNHNPLAMKPADLLDLKVAKLLLQGKPYSNGQGIPRLLAKGLLDGEGI